MALEVLADHRDDPTALAYIGRMHEQALRALDRALALNPYSVPALCSSGWVRVYVGDARVAIDHFQQAIRLNPLGPQHSYLLTGLGYAYIMSGRLDEALSILKQALLETPEWATTLLAKVHCLVGLNRLEDAARLPPSFCSCPVLLHLRPAHDDTFCRSDVRGEAYGNAPSG